MRFLIIVTATLMAVSSYAQAVSDEFEIRHTADLVAVCAVEPGEENYASAIAFCHGVLVGAYGYFEAATPADERFVCSALPYPKRSTVMSDFVAWIEVHPEHLDKHATDTLFVYLAEAYPCTK